jgi:hypothetical protein
VVAVTRHSFGGGIADYVVAYGAGGVLELAAGASVTFWDSPVGGLQYDLVDANEAEIPGGTVTADEYGAIPAFGKGPEGIRAMWAQASDGEGGAAGPRRLMYANDLGNELVDLQARLATVEQKLTGVGRITVAATAPANPGIGDVWLDTSAPAGSGPVTFREASGSASTSAMSNTCNLPGGLVPGDLLIAVLSMDATSTTATTSTPAGWDVLIAPDLIGMDTRVGVYTRVYEAGISAPTWNLTEAVKSTVVIAAYANADPQPQVGTAFVRSTQSSTIDAPGIITTDPDMMVVCVFGEKSSLATAITEPEGTTVRRAQLGAGTSVVPSVLVCDFPHLIPGPTSTRTATYNSSSNNGLGVQLGLRRRQV